MLRVLCGLVAVLFVVLSTHARAAPCAGFTDLDDSSPFCVNVAWMKNRGITLGCAPNLYCPNDAVVRLSMAAFLNRLGDAVLPPSVVWVAPVGGTYQTIQAAIDAVAPNASASNRVLVKVAPGTYNEALTMASFVDVEGSGRHSTIVTSNACEGSPRPATVTGANDAQLRAMTVRNTGAAAGPHCGAIYLPNVEGVPVRDVFAIAEGAATTNSAVRVDIATSNTVLRDLELRASNATFGFGIVAQQPSGGTLMMQDVQVHAIATSAAVAVGLVNASADLERVSLSAVGPGSNVGVEALVGGVVLVRNSRLSTIGQVARQTASAQIRIAESVVFGTVGAGVICLYTYQFDLSPAC